MSRIIHDFFEVIETAVELKKYRHNVTFIGF